MLKHKQDCKIQFCDNGNGIPNEIKNKIFNEGFSHGETGHTGVGLYIVNNKPNGTTFTIKLKKVIA